MIVTNPDPSQYGPGSPNPDLYLTTYRGVYLVRKLPTPPHHWTWHQLQHQEIFRFLMTDFPNCPPSLKDEWDYTGAGSYHNPILNFLTYNLAVARAETLALAATKDPPSWPYPPDTIASYNVTHVAQRTEFSFQMTFPAGHTWGVIIHASKSGIQELTPNALGSFRGIAGWYTLREYRAVVHRKMASYNLWAAPIGFNGEKAEPMQLEH